ncbi:MAG: type IX secretion system membrane protein PorP/SprF [Bacteroidota bacterium]|nr:type IX secretion system membrane protein PorP/SprF [Bacteroidota bacterium]
MKKISVLIFATFLGGIVSGQQLPQVTQYMINNYAINPAVSTMYDYYQLKTTVRNQWVGMPDAPTTTLLSIYGKRNENVGLGALLFNDQTGVTGRVGGSVSYTYDFSLTENMRLAFALAAGFTQFKIDMTGFDNVDPGDPAFGRKHIIEEAVPDATFGFNLYTDNWYFGIAVPQLLGYTVKTIDPDFLPDSVDLVSSGTLAKHYFAHGAYNFELSPYFGLEPSFLVKSIAGITQIDFGLKAIYNDMLWGGMNYRNNGDIAGIVGYSFQERYEIGYAYEMVNSELKTYAPVTHEFVIGIKFKPATEDEILFYR